MNALYVDALAPGTNVGEFEIVDVVGQGGFGIVYTAIHPLFGTVALKEFFPKSQASRAHSGTIVPSSPAKVDAFRKGVQRLIAEGRKLKSLRHPGIVRVFGVFESHGSAYLIMEKVAGASLEQAVGSHELSATPSMVKEFTEKMVDALAAVHKIGLVHRDVAPDNILVERVAVEPQYVLIDFGGAKKVVTDESHSSSDAITKRGFSPPEQYAAEGSAGLSATPSTDIYSLCATVYWLVTGNRPLEAPARASVDSLVPLSRNPRLVDKFGAAWLAAIDQGMSLVPDKRFPDVRALQAALAGSASTGKSGRRLGWAMATAGLLAAIVATGSYFWPVKPPKPIVNTYPTITPAAPPAASSESVVTIPPPPDPAPAPSPVPEPSTFPLTVTTDPADAAVTIDGAPYGSGMQYAAGTHEIAVSKLCFEPTTESIDLQAAAERTYALTKRTRTVMVPGPQECKHEIVEPARPAEKHSDVLDSEETEDGRLGTDASSVCLKAKNKARRALVSDCDDGDLRYVDIDCQCQVADQRMDAFGNTFFAYSCTASGSATCKTETAAVAEVTKQTCAPTQVPIEECY